MRGVLGGIVAAGLFAVLNAGASAQMMIPAMPNYTGQPQMRSNYYYSQQTMPNRGLFRGRNRIRYYSSGYQGVTAAPVTTVTTPTTTVTTAVPVYRNVVRTRHYTMRPRMTRGRRMWRGMNPWRGWRRRGYTY